MLQLDVLRHGQTEQGHTLRGHLDDALTLQGWQQMQNTIDQHLKEHSVWDAIVSSPLQRCSLFAQKIQQQLGCPLIEMPEFKELYFGRWEGKTVQHIHETEPELLGQFWQDPSQYAAPQGENLLQFQQRLELGLHQLITQAEQQKWHSVLLISHGGVIKWLRCIARQHALNQLLSMPAELAHMIRFRLDLSVSSKLQLQEIQE